LNYLSRQTRGDRAIDPNELAPERTGSQVREVEGLSRRAAHALEGSIDVSVYCVDHTRSLIRPTSARSGFLEARA
jgi:hypothetical protein